MGETKNEWQYDAFISYRHLEPDAYVAGTLHKLLESYKLPGNLIKSNGDKLKRTKINKVFRDAEELPLTSNLNDTIIEALSNSEYLIAICSPRFGESLWCKKEVDTFIEMRGIDHVLTVLVDGEPSESFPEALLYRNVEVTKPDGSVEIVREPIEPLAANARGANRRERLKVLKNEYLRLMAPMFGCSFDDLKQRHREQRMKRTLRIVAGIAAFAIAFGVVSTSMALRIQKQNNQISEQNQQIAVQAEKIELQYKEALINNANSEGDNARTLLEQGDKVNAIKKALSVYPKDGEDIPYVPKVEYVLSDALNLYENGSRILPDRLISFDSVVADAILSPNGDILIAETSDRTLWVCDTVTGDIKAQLGDTDSTEIRAVDFIDDKHIIYACEGNICIYDVDDNSIEIICETDEFSLGVLMYSADNNRILAAGYNNVFLIDADSKEIITTICVDDVEEISGKNLSIVSYSDITKMGDGDNGFFVVYFSDSASDDVVMCIYSVEDGHLMSYESFKDLSITATVISENKLYVSLLGYADEGNRLSSSNFISYVMSYDITENGLKKNWSRTIENVYIRDIQVSKLGEGVACQCFDRVEVISKQDGSTINKYQIERNIIKLIAYQTADVFSCITKDGKWISLSPTYNEPIITNNFVCNSNSVTHFLINGCVATIPESSNVVTVYRVGIAKEYEEVADIECQEPQQIELTEELAAEFEKLGVKGSFIGNLFTDEENKYLGVSYKNNTVEIFRMNSNKMPTESCGKFSGFGEEMKQLAIKKDGEYMLLGGSSSAYIFRTEGVDYNASFPDESMIVAYVPFYRGVNLEDSCVYVRSGDGFLKIRISDANSVGKMAQETLDKILQ